MFRIIILRALVAVVLVWAAILDFISFVYLYKGVMSPYCAYLKCGIGWICCISAKTVFIHCTGVNNKQMALDETGKIQNGRW